MTDTIGPSMLALVGCHKDVEMEKRFGGNLRWEYHIHKRMNSWWAEDMSIGQARAHIGYWMNELEPFGTLYVMWFQSLNLFTISLFWSPDEIEAINDTGDCPFRLRSDYEYNV